jgi:hypothetical protein
MVPAIVTGEPEGMALPRFLYAKKGERNTESCFLPQRNYIW